MVAINGRLTMKYLLLILGCLMLGGCNLIPNEDPNVHQSLQIFEQSIQAKDADAAWQMLTPDAQAALNEPAFRALIAAGATYEDMLQLFRNAGLTTRNIRTDIKAEQPIALKDATGKEVIVRTVFVQQTDGSWKVENILDY